MADNKTLTRYMRVKTGNKMLAILWLHKAGQTVMMRVVRATESDRATLADHIRALGYTPAMVD